LVEEDFIVTLGKKKRKKEEGEMEVEVSWSGMERFALSEDWGSLLIVEDTNAKSIRNKKTVE